MQPIFEHLFASRVRRRVAIALSVAGVALSAPAGAQATGFSGTMMTSSGYPAYGTPVRFTATLPDGSAQMSAVTVKQDGSFSGDAPTGSTVKIEASGQAVNPDFSWKPDGCQGGIAPQIASASVSVASDSAQNKVSMTLPQVIPFLHDPSTSAEEQKLVDLVNAERAKNGAGPLTIVPRFNYAADGEASWWNSTPEGFDPDHMGANCEGPVTRADEVGITTDPGATVMEVETAGLTAEDAFSWWMSSSGHRAMLLDPRNQVVGIAQVSTCWVADLAAGVGVVGPDPVRPVYTPKNDPTKGGSGTDDNQVPLSLNTLHAVGAGQTVTLSGVASPGTNVTLLLHSPAGGRDRSLQATANQDGIFRTRAIVDRTVQVTATAGQQRVTKTLTVAARLRVRIHAGKLTGALLPALSGKTVKLVVRTAHGSKTVKLRTKKHGVFSARLRGARSVTASVATVPALYQAGRAQARAH